MTGVDEVVAEVLTLADLLKDGVFTDGDWVESKDQDPQGDVRLIQLADVGDGVFRDRSSRFLTMATAKRLRCTFLEPGDVLVARMPEPLGRACVFPGVGQPAVTVVDVCVLRANPRAVVGEWLVKAINSPGFRDSMQSFVRGTTRQRISRRNLGSLNVRVPSLAEQRSLANLVDQLEEKRASAGHHVDAAHRVVERLRQAVLASACSGRLTIGWRETAELGRSADDLIDESRSSIAAASARRSRPETWLEPDWLSLPDSWRWAPMRDLALVKGGIQKQPKRTPSANPHPYLRVANVQRGRLELEQIHEIELFNGELATYRLMPGDLLVVEGNGSPTEIGRAALWRGDIEHCVHQNHIIRVRCMVMDPDFAVLYWNSPLGAREIASQAVTSSGLYSLSTKKIGAVPVPVPPLDEQREIVRRAKAMLALVDELQHRVETVRMRVADASPAVLARVLRDELSLGRAG